ncbi:transposase [Actinomadura nitritigenes]|uniref:transposase n=1 Tax=Actinomadura nitritigenes TaxID=134602 RepID=UPI0036BC778F
MILIITEVRVRDYGFSTAQQEELWGRWRSGEPLGGIARSMGAQLQHVRRFLLQTGGLRSPPRCRSLRHLAGEEREEISRGIAAGKSARAIARGLGRPASTVSREIARNGGREGYRAGAAAEVRARRPKQAKLAGRPDLRVMVEELLGQRWSPQQISGRLSTATHSPIISPSPMVVPTCPAWQRPPLPHPPSLKKISGQEDRLNDRHAAHRSGGSIAVEVAMNVLISTPTALPLRQDAPGAGGGCRAEVRHDLVSSLCRRGRGLYRRGGVGPLGAGSF